MAETNGGGVGDQAQQAAADVQEKGKEKAQEVTAQAKSKLREQVDQRSTQAGQQVRGTAADVRTVAEEFRRQGKDGPARFAEQAADRVERAGGWLEDSDGDRILRDVEDFGRRNPWAVVAGGLALGFLASRLLKASSQDRYRSSLAERPPQRLPGDGGTPRPDPTGYGSAAAGTASPEVPAAPPREPATTGGI
jgi:hypothetical protein